MAMQVKSFWKSAITKPFYKTVFGRRRPCVQQDGHICSFGSSLAHPAGVRLGIDRTKRLYARPVRHLNQVEFLPVPFFT